MSLSTLVPVPSTPPAGLLLAVAILAVAAALLAVVGRVRRHSASRAETRHLSTADLEHVWEMTGRLLGDGSATWQALVVARRQALLEELERREPDILGRLVGRSPRGDKRRGPG